MARGINTDDLPSKKYDKELKNGINYEHIVRYIESDKFSSEDNFWKTTLYDYVSKYISTHVEQWPQSNSNKRCRDFNNILDIMLKKINHKIETKTNNSYTLIEEYINNAATNNLMIYTHKCKRESKLSTHSDDIENMKKIDDLCEDVAYIGEKISEIHKNDCKQIENYLDQQIANVKNIYTSTKYSDILGYYGFTQFDKIDNIVGNFKSKCQEGTTGASLAGDHSETSQHSGRSDSIIAVTSLSGILSSFFLLYKTTSFGSILNNLVGKKIKFGNNLSDESYHETLEDISESSHDRGYNILYNSVGDS
ncbi:PIR Superfamily Protein [Plasmodium ovale wallikeri]|uniref:PIR Superfamily Protein n=1 Tax=Plasmodium ovale wallikeri TaxID=864142 RepID=A0A1A9AQI6_PLAOA|nr:PIR Superfamily Protein [Plasmodium ovale wallikeri]SBT58440.1 PIR Superfamily Protein [Plasmodium ovale wallikeri]